MPEELNVTTVDVHFSDDSTQTSTSGVLIDVKDKGDGAQVCTMVYGVTQKMLIAAATSLLIALQNEGISPVEILTSMMAQKHMGGKNHAEDI